MSAHEMTAPPINGRSSRMGYISCSRFTLSAPQRVTCALGTLTQSDAAVEPMKRYSKERHSSDGQLQSFAYRD
jgi:hypothetical protein